MSDPSVIIRTKPKLQRPSMYTVVFLNDDYTPMEFVVRLLKQFFNLSDSAAVVLMLKIHKSGKASVGSYTYEVAAHKVDLVLELAKKHSHPLQAYPDQLA